MKNLKKIDFLLKKLFNMNRTLISKENRNTFNIIKKIIPLKILKFKTNSKVFDIYLIPEKTDSINKTLNALSKFATISISI